jgi:hypothetical protein
MKSKIFRMCNYLLVVGGLFGFAIQSAQASAGSQISGSYQVVQKTDLGSQTRVRLELHLINHGPAIHIQGLTLWDFSHPDKGGTQACSIVVDAGASADTTQEFTIQQSEYQLWQRGLRPRFVLRIDGPGSTKSTAVVRLERVSKQEAK